MLDGFYIYSCIYICVSLRFDLYTYIHRVNACFPSYRQAGGCGRRMRDHTRQIKYTSKCVCVAAPSPRASLGRRTVCGRMEQLSAAGFEALRN